MKLAIFIMLVIIEASTFGQSKPVLKIMHNVDSIVTSINKQKLVALHECDSIMDITGHKDYKCFNYFFEDSSMRNLAKVSISFNNCAENLYFYYHLNKVIKLDNYSVINCKQYSKWSVYMYDDREIYVDGNRGRIAKDEVESGYYFLTLAFDYLTTKQIIEKFPHITVIYPSTGKCFNKQDVPSHN